MRRFDCYPDDFLSGTQGLGPILGWAYTRLFMKMYADGGPLDYDTQKLKFLLEMRPQDVRKVVEILVTKGKLSVDGGFIHNGRVDKEISKRSESNHYVFRTNGGDMTGQMKLHFPGHNSEKLNDSTRARAPAFPSPSPSKKKESFNGSALPPARAPALGLEGRAVAASTPEETLTADEIAAIKERLSWAH
jgi:uncharacterized protein YdaU (DUF1376 family)